MRRGTPTQHAVALIVLLGFLAVVAMLGWHSVPSENKEAVMQGMAVLGTAFGLVVGFYFNSAASSRSTDSAPKPPTPEEPKP